MDKGKIIVIESGTDGSGKSTQIELLYSRLISDGYNVRKYKYPNYTNKSSTFIKMYLGGEFGNNPNETNPYVISTFFAVDRVCGYEEWKEFYLNGGIVLLDRYTTSNMIHQTIKLDIEKRDDFLNWLEDLEYNKFALPKPDVVFFLNLNPNISLELINKRNRINNNNSVDIHEGSPEFLAKSYENAKYIAQKYNWVNVFCDDGKSIRSIENINNEIYSSLSKLIE